MATSSYYTYGTNLRNKEFFTSTINTKDGIKRYFSNIDAEIYFGNENITNEVCDFSFSVEEKKLPVYSYNKFYPDIIIPGQRIVQGSFALNFTNGAYMRNVLSKIDNSVLNTSYFDEELYNPGKDSKNRSLWNKNFDITIGYGDYKSSSSSYNATCQTICGVQITNMGKAISSKTGEPILEVYSFIGKDFIDEENNEYNSNNVEKNDNSNDKNNNDSTGNNEDKKDKFGIIYDAVFQQSSEDQYQDDTSNLYVDLFFSKDIKDEMKTCAEKGTFEITDNKLSNPEYPNASRIFTLKRGDIINKNTSKKENVFVLRYQIDYSLNTRPLGKMLYKYFNTNNKDTTLKCNFKYSVTIDGKTEYLSKDLNLRYEY